MLSTSSAQIFDAMKELDPGTGVYSQLVILESGGQISNSVNKSSKPMEHFLKNHCLDFHLQKLQIVHLEVL